MADFIQAGILVLSGLAVWLVNCTDRDARWWGCIAGLVSQPLWIYASAKAGQWGMLALSLFYTLAWARGAWKLRG